MDQVDVIGTVRLWFARWRRDRFWMNAWHHRMEESKPSWDEIKGIQ